MRFLYKGKDGGPDSLVTGFWFIEIKSLFSIVLLKFNRGYREQYHTHAFNAWTWFLSGFMVEQRIYERARGWEDYKRSILPKVTKRDNLHRVVAARDSWCLSIRGPWAKTWQEYDEVTNTFKTLTNGRKII